LAMESLALFEKPEGP